MTQQDEREVEYKLIAIKAYALYEARGCEHGHDLEDWLTAEAEVRSQPEEANPLNVAAKSTAKSD